MPAQLFWEYALSFVLTPLLFLVLLWSTSKGSSYNEDKKSPKTSKITFDLSKFLLGLLYIGLSAFYISLSKGHTLTDDQWFAFLWVGLGGLWIGMSAPYGIRTPRQKRK